MVGTSSDTVGWMCMARWMTVYGAFAYMTVEERVNDFVSVDTQDGRAQDLLGVGVDEHLHEAVGFASLLGASHIGHHPFEV